MADGSSPPYFAIVKIHFSPRQEEVLSLIADGLTDKEIALRLGVGQRTVRTHLERLYAQNGLHNRAGALTIWLRSQSAAAAADVG
jgi:DNA-binding CsgD family transcriptional regulator